MEDSFGINNVALVDGRPQTLGLRDLIGVYLAHRVMVTRRRSKNRLGKRQARLHLVEGLLKAILNIDEVIEVIRSSDEAEQARSKLMSVFDLSELQAEYILELRLRRLTKFSRIELDAEQNQLKQEIVELERILGSDAALREIISSELLAVAEKYGDARRTELVDDDGSVKPFSAAKLTASSVELSDEPCSIRLSSSGHLLRVPTGGTSDEAPRSSHDALKVEITTTTRSDIGFVTNFGRVIRVHAGDIPAGTIEVFANASISVSEFLGLSSDERVLTALELIESNEIALATQQGIIKRVIADYPAKDDFEIINLKDGDRLVGAEVCTDNDRFVLIASDSQLLTFDAALVRAQGRAASGVAGMNLSSGSRVIYFGVIGSSELETATVLTAACSSLALQGTDPGSAKLSLLSEFPTKGRATGGVRSHKFLKGEDSLYFAWAGRATPKLSAPDGRPIKVNLSLAKRDASGEKLAGVIGSAGA
jgi:DNA gyrase subunit A